MKLIQKNEESTWYLVEEWETESGLKARIHQCVWSDKVKRIATKLHDHYTAYVQVPDGIIPPSENSLDVHGGATFYMKPLPTTEGLWIGFDMAHLGDEMIKNGLEYAKEECEKLAKQIKQ